MVQGQGGTCDKASAEALKDRWQAIR